MIFVKKLYKGNLHSHSTLSDGTQTPEELKELYKANGYSIYTLREYLEQGDKFDEKYNSKTCKQY